MTFLLATILTLVLAPTPAPAPPASAAGELTSLAEQDVVQFQHDLAVPDIVFGAWVAVPIPGTTYELHVRFDDGTSMLLTSGVVPASGVAIYAWWVVHDEFPQRVERAELWSISDAPLAAVAELFD